MGFKVNHYIGAIVFYDLQNFIKNSGYNKNQTALSIEGQFD